MVQPKKAPGTYKKSTFLFLHEREKKTKMIESGAAALIKRNKPEPSFAKLDKHKQLPPTQGRGCGRKTYVGVAGWACPDTWLEHDRSRILYARVRVSHMHNVNIA